MNGTKGSGAASVAYTAKGTTLDIVSEDSLVDIASKINNASYPTGNEVLASIVDNQLILTAKYSGSQFTNQAHKHDWCNCTSDKQALFFVGNQRH